MTLLALIFENREKLLTIDTAMIWQAKADQKSVTWISTNKAWPILQQWKESLNKVTKDMRDLPAYEALKLICFQP